MDRKGLDVPAIGRAPDLPGGRAFSYVVFTTPLFLIVNVFPLQVLGCIALAYILTRPWSSARREPALLAFLFFSLVVMAANDYSGRALREITIPYTGWLATPPYEMSIFFVVVALAFGLPRFRLAVVAMCLLQVAMGTLEWAMDGMRESPNPYLRVSAWRPIWTVLLPLTWALVVARRHIGRARPGRDGPENGEPPPNNALQLTSGAAKMGAARC